MEQSSGIEIIEAQSPKACSSGVRTTLIVILLVVLASSVWFLNYQKNFSGFLWNDCQDYNQMARNIYEGKGFSTSVLRPISFLAFNYLPHPEYTRPPLYPYLLAFFYSIFGVNDIAAVLVDGLFYVLFVVMTFLFSLELSRSRLIAAAVTASMALSDWFLRMSIMGSTDIVFAAIFMVFLFMLVKYHQKPLFIGLGVGLLYLTRWNAVFLAFALVLTLYNPLMKRISWKGFVVFCAGVMVMASPVIFRNMSLQGSALSAINASGLFAGGKSLPGYFYISQLNTVPAWEFIRQHPDEVTGLIVKKVFTLVKGFPKDFGIVLVLLMAGGLLVGLRDKEWSRIKTFIVWSVVVQTFFLVLLNAEARYYGFLLPPLALFVFLYVKELGNRHVELTACILIPALVLFLAAPLWQGGKSLNYYRVLGEEVKAQTGKDDIVISDLAWAMSWYGDRRAVWLTYDLDSMKKISEKIPITHALISLETIWNPLVPYKDRMWQRLLQEAGSYEQPGFHMVKKYYLGNQLIAVLYKVDKVN